MHITLTGKLGGGKSTVAAKLSKRLGYKVYSTGAIQREVASEMGITTLELNERMSNDPSLDFVIDDGVKELSRKPENLIFDSRMAWHFAENSFNVFLDIDPDEAARRVYADNRGEVEHYESEAQAKEDLLRRGDIERDRFKKIYNVDYFNHENYNLVIDTGDKSSDEIAEIIIEAYNKASI